ncbi:MerR family transcriptional regulator [Myxococcota bacterium]|nr:MerR family transcriptional regulator [Myxococcota bacterium]
MSNHAERAVEELTYPLGAAARLTGISPDTLRAWERRYEVVVPLRTPGGTRRYTASDLERLALVKAAIDGGHRIGQVARLGNDELARITTVEPAAPAPSELAAGSDASDAIMAALNALDADESERLIALQLAALGPSRFARHVASPLLERIGETWSRGDLPIAAEHLATSVLRSLMGASLRPSSNSPVGASILFATLSGERHELGLLIAAITAAAAGGRVVYLGAELPVDDLIFASDRSSAGAVAVSLVVDDSEMAVAQAKALRAGLPPRVELWVGGALSHLVRDVMGITVIDSFEALEQRVKLLGLESGRPGL